MDGEASGVWIDDLETKEPAVQISKTKLDVLSS